MKKSAKTIFALLGMVLLAPFYLCMPGGEAFGAETSFAGSETVAISTGDKTVTYVSVDLSDPSVGLSSAVSQNRIGTTDTLENIAALMESPEREVIAAINGTYFSAYDGNPLPWGTIQQNGEIIHIGNTGTAIGFTDDKKVTVDHLYVSIKGYINNVHRWYAWNINHTYDNCDAIAIMTPEYGTRTQDHPFTSIVVEDGKVVDKLKGATAIPENGYVIVTGLPEIITRFRTGQSVRYETLYSEIDFGRTPAGEGGYIDWKDVTTAIGAGPMLVKDGITIADGLAEGFFEEKINTLKCQRSFAGVTPENRLIMGTVPSATIPELAEIAREMGLIQALNLDGGASSGLYYEGRILHSPGRLLSNALVVTRERQSESTDVEIKVDINSSLLDFDQPPVIVEGRTLVPLRAIFEALGAEVEWNGETQMVTAVKGSTIIKLKIGSYAAERNGEALALEVPAMIMNGRTLVPARFIAECLGAVVDWDSGTRTVLINL